jgi:hypothetical protein
MAERSRKSAASDSLVAAANFVKRRARAIRATGTASSGSHTIETDCFIEWLKTRDKILRPDYFGQFQYIGSGAEHEVYHDFSNRRAIKLTLASSPFGWSVDHEGARATLFEYLRRLVYQNWFFGDVIQLVGGVVGEDYFQVVSSQPWISEDRTKPPATEAQIEKYFRDIRFYRVRKESTGGFFYNQDLNVVAADAHSRNVLISSEGEIVPIDVVMGKPSKAMQQQLKAELSPLSGSEVFVGSATPNVITTFSAGNPPASSNCPIQ